MKFLQKNEYSFRKIIYLCTQKRKNNFIMGTTETFSRTDAMALEAYWTLLRPLSRSVRHELAVRLGNSLTMPLPPDEPHKPRLDDALRFVKTLSVQGGRKVPANTKGIDALIEEKYTDA